MKPFEVVGREEPGEPGVYKIKAGVGCIALSIGWLAVTFLWVLALLTRSC
jgi:hypothetical protein